jgi:ABC-type transport system involved in multi-copper enzyme maturation permease subunit
MNSHIGLIASYSMRFAMRTGGGIIFILVLLTVGFSIASLFISPVEVLLDKSGTTAAEAYKLISTSNEVKGGVSWITGADETQSTYLITEKPALLSAILLSLLMFIPYTTCLGSFNQTAGDIGNRGFRYLLLRTERRNIFFGRFIGALAFTVISSVFTMAVVAFYLQFKIGIYSGVDIWMWSLQGLLAILALSLPYAALCAWFSAALDSAFASLAICLLVIGFTVLLLTLFQSMGTITMHMKPGDLNWLQRLTPWGWKYELLSSKAATRSLAYLAMAGFTGLFLWLGLRTFEKRDL